MEKKTTKTTKASPKPVEKPTNDGKYHVTKHPDGGWQVILGKGEKAVRRTKTQEEALKIVNELAESRHTTVYLHGKKGTIREAKSFKEEPKKAAKPVAKKEEKKPAVAKKEAKPAAKAEKKPVAKKETKPAAKKEAKPATKKAKK